MRLDFANVTRSVYTYCFTLMGKRIHVKAASDHINFGDPGAGNGPDD
jgi:hypothetical protein